MAIMSDSYRLVTYRHTFDDRETSCCLRQRLMWDSPNASQGAPDDLGICLKSDPQNGVDLGIVTLGRASRTGKRRIS